MRVYDRHGKNIFYFAIMCEILLSLNSKLEYYINCLDRKIVYNAIIGTVANFLLLLLSSNNYLAMTQSIQYRNGFSFVVVL